LPGRIISDLAFFIKHAPSIIICNHKLVIIDVLEFLLNDIFRMVKVNKIEVSFYPIFFKKKSVS